MQQHQFRFVFQANRTIRYICLIVRHKFLRLLLISQFSGCGNDIASIELIKCDDSQSVHEPATFIQGNIE